ncbi:MAG: aldolase/citrate lyase family protein [SAR202 cluster bacterium]|jgi:2-dehydro-3-deoxyglucarate aldolase/4-hydroxy-2-oxoheptanedioate aldolase|nr:aldolase [Chloroflexota bacterium]MDP6512912.1 aldolase/citrate lyase family protein [SAR202 cluster bacterium]MQG67174.1 aldolase [SAR202 cluster bacterium]|tara:strand:+ start:1733 stop:2509 length:777 start_codon:yes stop_codon:yes gene_type:complete
MKRNTLKERLIDNETAIGTMVQEVTSPAIAQIMHSVGFDFFMIDGEHSPFNPETVQGIVRVGRLLDMSPLVRVRALDYSLIAGYLDSGAMGIMLPRVESREDAEGLLSCMKYPPLGVRGLSSDAPHSDYQFGPLDEFIEVQNNETLAIVQIERTAAIENLDAILSVPGVDVALVGPEDLSLSLGVPGQTSHPSVQEAIQRVVDVSTAHGVVPGIHMGSVEALVNWQKQGMRMLMYNSDLGFVMEAGEAGLAILRSGIE